MIEFISQDWPWYVSGPLIAFTMFLLLYEGKRFGMSSNLRTMCSMAGAGKVSDFFKFDWKSQSWGLVVVLGSMIGGFVASHFLDASTEIHLNEKTVTALSELNISNPGATYLPSELFGIDALSSAYTWFLLLLGGLLVGFGSRYAGGCTSGHAISGLSNLEKPSLIAVIGFFIGGLIMTNFILPILL